MNNQPVIYMILSDQPMPTARERQISWLSTCFAMIANLPIDNVSIVYADENEAITVHLVCTCAERHMMTLTHWCTSEDEHYTFIRDDLLTMILPLEPTYGNLL